MSVDPSPTPRGPIVLTDMGSFHVGGKPVSLTGRAVIEVALGAGVPPARVDPNGRHHLGQCYVQYFVPERGPQRPSGAVPLVMLHGASATGAAFETKPDGGEGWLTWFLRRGWPVYATDGVGRGRAGWSPHEGDTTGPPTTFTAEHLFTLFRIGLPEGSYAADPAVRRDHPGTQFPTDCFDAFLSRAVPFWPPGADTIGTYVALLERIGPCVLLCHSQGGHFAFRAAQQRPDLVKAIVAVEPGSCGDPARFAALASVPVLVLFGDFVDEFPRMRGFRSMALESVCAINALGGRAELTDLPSIGIDGNSHVPMMDRNSDEVASVIQRWLVDKGLWTGFGN